MIEVTKLRKSFKFYNKPVDRLKELILRKPFHHRYVALDDISFYVNSGETLGILGQNGAGKSTLLKLLSGVLLPDAGNISLNGRITGLLELGTGFDPNMSGRHNIHINGLLIGMSNAEIEVREERIIAFSELGSFIDEPLRTYSSGMIMRLAFSIAIHADPTCFLIDEALSVGDGHFQQKCIKRIREFRESGGSIIFVSHDLNAVKMICDRAIVLEKGKVVFSGDAENAVNAYNKIMAKLDEQENLLTQSSDQNREYGTREAEIIHASLTGDNSNSHVVSTGETVTLTVRFKANTFLPSTTLGFVIRDRFGQDIFGTNTYYLDHKITDTKEGVIHVDIRFQAMFSAGKYTVTLALHDEEHHLNACYHWFDNYLQFEVAGSQVPLFSGVAYFPVKISHSTGK